MRLRSRSLLLRPKPILIGILLLLSASTLNASNFFKLGVTMQKDSSELVCQMYWDFETKKKE